MNEIHIDKLVEAVQASNFEQEKQRKQNLIRQVQYLQAYAKQNDVTLLERIPIKPTVTTVEIQTEKTKTWKCGNSKTIDCGKMTITHEVKQVTITDEDIISAIRTVNPQNIDQKIYWYDNGKYLFCTDKDVIYNLRKYPRLLRTEEQEKITNIISDIEQNKNKVLPMLRQAKYLQAYITPWEERTEEQQEIANSGECTMYLLEVAKDIAKANASSIQNIYGQTVQQHVISRVIKNAISARMAHDKLVNDGLITIQNIYRSCYDEPIYYIHPMKQNKQIKIYIGEKLQKKYQNLGYKIYQTIHDEVRKNYIENKGLLEEVQQKCSKTSYYIQMCKTSFISICKNGKLCKMGMVWDEQGNEVPLTRRPLEPIDITLEDGTILHFNSKTQAAKHFNVSNKVITNVVKNGCKFVKNNEKNRKNITLKSADGTILCFTSLTQASQELNTNKMNISRAIKNKSMGDVVKINGIEYTLQDN